VLKWYHLDNGADNLDYKGSPDQQQWDAWQAARRKVAN